MARPSATARRRILGSTGEFAHLSMERVVRIARDCPNIVGIKDTVDSMVHLRRLVLEGKAAPPDFLIFAGDDEYMLDTLLLGGDGGIPASSNFAPEIACGLYAAYKAGDVAAITALAPRLGILETPLLLDTPFAGPLKAAVRLCGLDIPMGVALPATPPDAAIKAKVAPMKFRLRGDSVGSTHQIRWSSQEDVRMGQGLAIRTDIAIRCILMVAGSITNTRRKGHLRVCLFSREMRESSRKSDISLV